MELVEEREALFYLLPQTTPERLAKNLTGYTIDPKTRYPNLSKWCLSVFALLWRTMKLALRLGFLESAKSMYLHTHKQCVSFVFKGALFSESKLHYVNNVRHEYASIYLKFVVI